MGNSANRNAAPVPPHAQHADYTAQQLRALLAQGVRPDLSLVPHQMERVPDAAFQSLPAPKPRETVTVQNVVNLNKKTLRVEGSAGRIRVAFSFDALNPCRVAVHFCASETVDALNTTVRLDPMLTRSQPRTVDFAAGLNQQFVLPDEDALDLSKLAIPPAQVEQALTRHTAQNWPLVIVLSQTGEQKGSASATGGTSQQSDAQSTYAVFVRRPDGALGIKVIKQKIRIGAHSHELQEIFGLEPKVVETKSLPPAAAAVAATGTVAPTSLVAAAPQECVICMSNPRDTTVLPCRHMCLCSECANIVRVQTNRCPICRAVVHSMMHVPLSLSTAAVASLQSNHVPIHAPAPEAANSSAATSTSASNRTTSSSNAAASGAGAASTLAGSTLSAPNTSSQPQQQQHGSNGGGGGGGGQRGTFAVMSSEQS